MDSPPRQTFNTVYSGRGCYYGLEVRPEFSDFFAQRDATGLWGLDLGCGEGRYALYLAAKGCRVTAVDISRVGLEKLEHMARAKELPVTTCHRDIADFAFPEAAYDIIVAATILDHLDDPLRKRTIQNIKYALKPGGHLYANVFTRSDPGCKMQAAAGHSPPSAEGVSETAGCIAHYFSSRELKTVFSDLSIITYDEAVEPDHSHGRPHFHGWAWLLAQKPF